MRSINKYLLAAIVTSATFVMTACTAPDDEQPTPSLAERGTTMTTVTLSKQTLTTSVSLSGKVTLDPVFGLVSPVGGQVRYFTTRPANGTPTTPTQVANVWAAGVAHAVRVPAGATFAGRLVDDKSTVVAGTPIVSAKHGGYGLVADIDGAQAYQLGDSLKSVKAQIKNGPGPFKCRVLGTIAALPDGTIPSEPDPPAGDSSDSSDTDKGGNGGDDGSAEPPAPPGHGPGDPGNAEPQPESSEPTGMRVVCLPPASVKMINGASATIKIITAKAKNALVAPVEAVAGSTGKGQVDVIGADGSRKTVTVKLGMTDGKVIQIKSGLEGDETLAVPGPNLPPAEDGQGEGGPKGGEVRLGG